MRLFPTQMMKDGQKKARNITDKLLGWMSVRLQEDADASAPAGKHRLHAPVQVTPSVQHPFTVWYSNFLGPPGATSYAGALFTSESLAGGTRRGSA